MKMFLSKKANPLNTRNQIIISKKAIVQNYNTLQKLHPEAKTAPVLKSNAYGHGLQTVGPIFDSLGPEFLIVNSLREAYELKKLNLKTTILILGQLHKSSLKQKMPFQITVSDLETARQFNKYQKNGSVHLFVDTGMNREGVSLDKLPELLKGLKKLTNINVNGLISHFADSDNPDDLFFTEMQVDNYKKALNILIAEGFKPKYRHISASGGIFKIKDPVFNLIRAGLASYGINPLEEKDPEYKKVKLIPALQLVSTLVLIKRIRKGDKIGYNSTFEAKKDMTVGLLPLGYYEGVDRRLSGKGFVTIKGTACPILGRISMNMTSIDLTDVRSPKIGDNVIVISDNPKERNSLSNLAKLANTIPYDLLVHLATSIERTVV